MSKKFRIIGIGEILWDVFPTGKQLGGAPASFAYHVSAQGNEGIIISRIGNDELGNGVINCLKGVGLVTDYIQIDGNKPTGTVEVKIDDSNQPDYIIKEDVAWDFLEWSPDFKLLLKSVDAVCFGTLSQRNIVSRQTILKFLSGVKNDIVKILDINLRQNFFNEQVIEESLRLSDILKLNSSELEILGKLLEINEKYDEKDLCIFLISKYKIKLICLTKGEEGSILINENSFHESPAYPYLVVDRVGAGDAFTAAMIIQFLKGNSLDIINDYANKLASWVTSKSGGMPIYDSDIRNIMNL